jgi:hypothetical protein
MNLMESILGGGEGGAGTSAAIGKIAAKLGLPESLAAQAANALSPALARGLQRNTAQPGGLEALTQALRTGQHQRYVDDPNTLDSDDAVNDGNAILGHIFGSKDVSRNVAGNAAQQTGIDAGLLRQMLPMLAGVVMGSLSKQTEGGAQLSASPGAGGAGANPLAALSGLLDADKDGSAMDELLDLGKRYF